MLTQFSITKYTTLYTKSYTILKQNVFYKNINFYSFDVLLIMLSIVNFYAYCNVLRSIAILVAEESGRGNGSRGVWLRILFRSAAMIAICSETGRLKKISWIA
jgi:hypothetical protein